MALTHRDPEYMPGEPSFDPFELTDTVGGTVRDPYPRMRALRAESPVHTGFVDLGGPGGSEVSDRAVTVLGYDEVVQVLRDGQTFSSSVYGSVIGMVMGRTILEMDEPQHRAHRALVAPAFRSKVLRRWELDLVRSVVDERIDTFVGRGRADLVRELTFTFPVQVIARILGLPREDYPRFQRWAIEITSVAANWARGVAASAALREYFSQVLEERRRQPEDDLITDLTQVEVEGERLTDEEIFSFLRLLLPAGIETTYRATSSMLFGLLMHPDQFARVRADRSVIPQAFEETLRWESPVGLVLRRATRDVELAGVGVTEGADVVLVLGSANHDERRFDHPEEFDVLRSNRQHVGFGFGAHACLGMHLARMEARVALEALLDRFDRIDLDPEPGAAAPCIVGLAFRSPTALPVALAAA